MVISTGLLNVHESRRKAVTLLCIILASAPIMGISVYVDSFSLHDWDRFTDIGPVPIVIRGQEAYLIYTQVDTVPGVKNSSFLLYGSREIISTVGNESTRTWNRIVAIGPDYFDEFPEVYTFYSGRTVANNSEIALSRMMASNNGVDLGDILEYEANDIWYNLTVVGLYDLYAYNIAEELEDSLQAIQFGEAIVTVGVLFRDWATAMEIHVDIDMSSRSPFDTDSTLRYLNTIDEHIQSLYELAATTSIFYITNYISISIGEYTSWVDSLRSAQILRIWGMFLLTAFIILLAIRFNISERKQESDMFLMRGAEKIDVFFSQFKEIAVLAIIGCLTGLMLGVFFSRVALMSTGFLSFQSERFWTEPFLISIDSVFISLLLGILTPIVAFSLSISFDAAKKPIATRTGRLGRISKKVALVRLDALFIIGTLALLLGIFLGGVRIFQNSPLSPILSITPFALIIGLASLFTKGMSRGAFFISRALSPMIGNIPAKVGIRKIGRKASSTAPTIIVLVLAMSLACNHVVLGVSMVPTKEYHARFAFGADARFHLNSANTSGWQNFEQIVSNHETVVATTIVSIGTMFLSTGIADDVDFVAINPDEYRQVGYNHLGYPLDQTSLNDSLTEMETNPTGVIVTKDIALEYELSPGDSLRARIISGAQEATYGFTILDVVEGLSNCLLSDTGTDESPGLWSKFVGKGVIWANREFLMIELDFNFRQGSKLCVRTVDGMNSTEMAEEVIANAPGNTVEQDVWVTKDLEIDAFSRKPSYQMDRAVDTILLVSLLFVVLAAFTTFSAEHLASRRREVALMRAFGATRRQVVTTQASEIFIISLFSLGLLILYGPLLTYISIISHSISSYVYPLTVFSVIPYGLLGSIIAIFLLSIGSFVLAVALLSSRVDLAGAMKETWAEGGVI